MNRIHRLTAILIHLQTKSVIPAREIADRFNISIRTVYRDIRALEEAGVPIGAQPGEGYFIIEGFHLPPVMFTRKEAGALLLGGKLMNRYSDVTALRQFESALFKIKSVIGQTDKDYLEQLDANIEVLSWNPLGIEDQEGGILSDLQSFIGQSKMAEISYTSGYKDETTSRLIEPLGLCYWGGNWHLVAYCALRKAYRDFRVSRISQIKPTGMIFDRQRHESLKGVLEKMNTPEALKAAVIRFSVSSANVIKEQKYYYGFVEETEKGETVEMTFLTPSYANFSIWLLTFLDQIEVVSPDILKEQLAAYTIRLQKTYL